MPDKKNQHYVPRFYLKKFSDSDKRTINLFNIKSQKCVLGASLKNQCYEPYFYDTTGNIENALGWLETKASQVIDKIISTAIIPNGNSQEYAVLLLYILTQHLRTKYVSAEIHEMIEKMEEVAFREHPNADRRGFNDYKTTPKNTVQMLLIGAADAFFLATDLSIKVIRNESQVPFITSDNPVVNYNQYMEAFTAVSYTGLAAHGLQVFFPISPHEMIHLYDPFVYVVGQKKPYFCEICDDAEALKFNELQWLNARDNVYYSLVSSLSSVESQAKRFLPLRRTALVEVVELPNPNVKENATLMRSTRLDLKTGLRPSFVRIKKARKNVPLSLRPLVRDPNALQALRAFSKEVVAGHYLPGDYVKVLTDRFVDHRT